jgi:hypothetical protein
LEHQRKDCRALLQIAADVVVVIANGLIEVVAGAVVAGVLATKLETIRNDLTSLIMLDAGEVVTAAKRKATNYQRGLSRTLQLVKPQYFRSYLL